MKNTKSSEMINLIIKDFKISEKFIDGESSPAQNDIIYIKGYANRYLDNNGQLIVDRSGDAIMPSGYDLKNFMKNPILLSYHDRYEPVGKIIDIQVTPSGLEVSAEVHRTLNHKVYYAVEQGILKTFSVSFRAIDTTYNPDTDVYYYKEVELLEVSIVSVPDNQDSLFTVLTQSPCANGVCMLASKATDEYTFKCASKIKNKDLSETKWVEVDKSELNTSLSEELPELVKEAYLVVGDITKNQTWKFPHHEYKNGKLFISKEGLSSALSSLKSLKVESKYSQEVMLDACNHLMKHFKDLVELDSSVEVPKELSEWIDTLEKASTSENRDSSTALDNDNDNNAENSEEEVTTINQDVDKKPDEGTAEEEVHSSDTLTMEQVLDFVGSTESSELGVSQLLLLHQTVEARVNSLLN